MARYNWPLLTATLVASVLVSVALSLLLNPWILLGFLLFLPFLPRIAWKRDEQSPRRLVCPRCGYQARGSDERYCPRDGWPLAAP